VCACVYVCVCMCVCVCVDQQQTVVWQCGCFCSGGGNGGPLVHSIRVRAGTGCLETVCEAIIKKLRSLQHAIPGNQPNRSVGFVLVFHSWEPTTM